MGVQKSNLNNKEIIKILKDYYQVIPMKITKINKGTANIFKIETKKHSYILKEFPNYIHEEVIKKDIAIINFLKSKNIQVPNYIKTYDNNYYMQVKNGFIILQEYIAGMTIDSHQATETEILKSATLLGKITKELLEYPSLEFSKYWGSKEETINRLNDLKTLKEKIANCPYKEQISRDLNDKIKITKYFLENYDFDNINKMTIINSHGDYNNTQLICNKNNIWVIDFEKAKKMPIIYEVIESFCSLDNVIENFNISHFILYMQEFSKYIPLNKYDLKYGISLFLIRTSNSVYGYKEYINDNSKIELLNFAVDRTALIRNLYNNLEKITNTLLKSIPIS